MNDERADAAAGGAKEPAARTPDPVQFCPNCSAQLKEEHCKLTCPRCGFYLSCSDFY